jgi:hypothetical protein
LSGDGSLTFADLIGKLDTLDVECSKCERKGRYSVTRLIEQQDRDGKLTDWLAKITADCPRGSGRSTCPISTAQPGLVDCDVSASRAHVCLRLAQKSPHAPIE